MITFKVTNNLRHLSRGSLNCDLFSRIIFNPTPILNSNLTLKAFRDPNYSRPAPLPYKTGFIHSLLVNTGFDKGLKRLDENSKFIVVEGNIGVGKSQVAKKIAEEFDLKYYPEASMDIKYINDYGYDLREMDPYIPEKLQSIDVNKFYKNPYHKAVPRLQLEMYRVKLLQYMDALRHLVNTGQGVVLERSHFSDFVFAKTMTKFNYMRNYMLKYYMRAREATAYEMMTPHLVIYLDAPVEVLMERIRKRNRPEEVNTSVLTPEYLRTIETNYKQYLDTARIESEVKVLDWTEFQDLDLLMLDIEKINFDRFDQNDTQLKEWRNLEFFSGSYLQFLRKRLNSGAERIMVNTYPIDLDAHEVIFLHDEMEIYDKVLEQFPGMKYESGYNQELGDSILLKRRINLGENKPFISLP